MVKKNWDVVLLLTIHDYEGGCAKKINGDERNVAEYQNYQEMAHSFKFICGEGRGNTHLSGVNVLKASTLLAAPVAVKFPPFS